MRSALKILPWLFATLACTLAAQTTPLRIEQTVEPQFPAVLGLSTLTHGEASVIINVDADSKLADLLVSGYTHKAFADEAVAVLRQWRYTAAREAGRPVGVRMELKFDFSATGRVVSLLPMETVDSLLPSAMTTRAFTRRVCLPRDLDVPIVPLTSVSPAHPGRLTASLPQTGSVLLDFYVDEYGQPRMPVVISSPHRAFAMAAVSALSQWRFTLPTRSGRPVAVRVRQEFIFPASS